MECRFCKKKIEFIYFDSINDQLKLTETCFKCMFWIEKIPYRNHIRTVISKEEYYHIGKGGGDKNFRGFAGRKWKIIFKGNQNLAEEEDKIKNDKGAIIQSIVYTDDLWYQGKIPEWFKKYLPDNVLELINID